MSCRRGHTAIYWPKVPLTIAALHYHPGWAAQPWITEGRKSSVCKLILTLVSCLQLTPTETGTRTDSSRLWHLVMQLFDTHLLPVGVRICTEFNHVHWSRWYSKYFDRMHLFRFLSLIYTCAYLDWQLGRGSICYILFFYKQGFGFILPTNFDMLKRETNTKSIVLTDDFHWSATDHNYPQLTKCIDKS